MSEAYKCDGCGEYYDGTPAATLEIDYDERTVGGDLVYVTERGTEEIPYSRNQTEINTCVRCARELIEVIE
jgi:ferredoxin